MSKFNPRLSAAFHQNTTPEGRPLKEKERLDVFKNVLPAAPATASGAPATNGLSNTLTQSNQDNTSAIRASPRKKPIRSFTMSQIHLLIYNVIHFFFSIYIRLRQAYHMVTNRTLSVLYYHHRTADLIRKDVQKLDRLPNHLSVVLKYKPEEGLEQLVHDLADVAAWCAAAQIPVLSVYERTGILKSYLPQAHRAITQTLHAYFGTPPARPILSLRAPQAPSFSPPQSPLSPFPGPDPFHLNVLLISEEDGRSTMVDLTKTLAEMSQKGKLSPEDVGKDLVDAELQEGVMDEPDILVLFGEKVVLEGYPPWQVRLTEIFHVPDNAEGVGYQVFLRALHRYAKAQMRFGR